MQNPLLELQEYENLAEALKKGRGPLQVTGTLDSQKVHLMYELGQDLPADGLHFPWKLVVTTTPPSSSIRCRSTLILCRVIRLPWMSAL